MAKGLLDRLSAGLMSQARRVAIYHVGVMIRWRWLARAVMPLLAGQALAVFDAGSGDGLYDFRLARRYSRSTFDGVELDPSRVAMCQARLRAEKLPNLSFAQGDLTRPQGADRYDLIYSVDVIEHIEDDRLMLRNLAQALRPGGHLFIHTPLAPQRHWLRRFDLDQRVQPLHVLAGYTVADLQAKLTEAGLAPTAVSYTHGRWGTLAWELWRLVEVHGLLCALLRPIVELLIAVEMAQPLRWGNCVLIDATKPIH